MALKKVLVYGNRKADDMCWDASTPELEQRAILKLFRHLNDVEEVYSVGLSKAEKSLHSRAMTNDFDAALKLLRLRQHEEYEEWHFMDVQP